MDLSFEYSPLYLLLILPIAAGLTWLMYRGTRDMLPRWAQVLLAAFRWGTLVLIGLLLLEPLLTSLSRLSYPPIIAVLQDQSESLVIQRDSAYVQGPFREELSAFLDRFDEDDYVVDLYGFAGEVAPGLVPDSLRFDETGTNISGALREVQARYQNQNLGALVLISDGISTAGMNPLYAVEGLKTPLYTVLLGDTTLQQDVRIQEVLFNEIAYLGNEVPVQVKVQSDGYDVANLKVTLRGDGKVLATRDLALGRNRAEGTVEFLIEPAEAGLRQYEVIVSRLPQEITYRNNSRRIFINVLETRVKIALFAGAPHPDLGALRQAFNTDEGYELTEFVLREPGTFYEDPGRYNLQDFDLFILHNFPQSRLDQGMVERLATLIKDENKPVIFLVGLFTDLATLSPLYSYMALTPREFSPRGEEITLDMQANYRQHSTYTFSDRWMEWINRAPPLYRNLSNWQPRSTAEVFATAKIKNVPLDYPVFALQSYLGRKNMVFLGENIWRLRAHSYIETEDFEAFDGWLYNLIKWLMVNDDKRKFKVEPSQRIYTGGQPVLLKGQVYDDSYNPVPGVEIRVVVTDPAGKETEYYLNEPRPAQYVLELFNLAEGTYAYRAEGRKNEVPVGEDRGQFSIGKSNVEHFQLRADQGLMQQLALRTGGSFTYARDLASLAEELEALPGLKPVIDYQRNRIPVRTYGWILGLLLLLLSVEWVVRKMHSLM